MEALPAKLQAPNHYKIEFSEELEMYLRGEAPAPQDNCLTQSPHHQKQTNMQHTFNLAGWDLPAIWHSETETGEPKSILGYTVRPYTKTQRERGHAPRRYITAPSHDLGITHSVRAIQVSSPEPRLPGTFGRGYLASGSGEGPGGL